MRKSHNIIIIIITILQGVVGLKHSMSGGRAEGLEEVTLEVKHDSVCCAGGGRETI